MNIVILTHYLPYPLSSGGAQAQFNMINELRHRHHITLIFNEGSGSTLKNMRRLRKIWPEVDIIAYPIYRQLFYFKFVHDKFRRAWQVIFTPESRKLKVERALLPYGQWFSKDHVHFVNQIIRKKKADLIQVEFFQQLAWINYLPLNIHRVFIHHEICFVRNERFLRDIPLSEQEERWMYRAKRKELRDLNKYDHVITLTDTDRDILMDYGVEIPVSVSPAAVNATPLPFKDWQGKIVFVGGYNHIPNREGMDWFLSQVAPKLPEGMQLDIIGSGWPAHYAKQKHIKVCLKGFVENLADAAYGQIMIVPLLTGSGMRMKILEAAAMSMPIVSTSVGVEGLSFKNKESCLIADFPAFFAQSIVYFSEDKELRKRLGEKARSIFEEQYSVKVLAEKRESIYEDIMSYPVDE